MPKYDNPNMHSVDASFDTFDIYIIYTSLNYYLAHNSFKSSTSKYIKQAISIFSPSSKPITKTEVAHHGKQVMPQHMTYASLALHYANVHVHDYYDYICSFDSDNVAKHAIDRLNSLMDSVADYTQQCHLATTNPTDLLKRLHKDMRWAKHGFVRSALDDIFKAYFVNHQTCTDDALDALSTLAVDVMDRHSDDNDFSFFVLDSVITGTNFGIKHHKTTLADQADNLKMYHKLQHQGYRYVVIGNSSLPHPVTKSDCLKFGGMIENLCLSLAVTDSDYTPSDLDNNHH